jgi:hypothetical protein
LRISFMQGWVLGFPSFPLSSRFRDFCGRGTCCSLSQVGAQDSCAPCPHNHSILPPGALPLPSGHDFSRVASRPEKIFQNPSSRSLFIVIPTPQCGARFFLPRRIVARRAAQWRDLSAALKRSDFHPGSLFSRMASLFLPPPGPHPCDFVLRKGGSWVSLPFLCHPARPPQEGSRDFCGRGTCCSPVCAGAQHVVPQSKMSARRHRVLFCASVAKEAVKQNELRMCGKCTVCKQSGMLQMHKCCE